MDWIYCTFLLLLLTNFGSACNNSQTMVEEVDGAGDEEGASRRRRALDDHQIIPFFSKCIKEKVPTLNWEKASLYVTFTVLQDVWFRAVASTICNNLNGTNTAECWKEKVESLLDSESIYYTPTMNCMEEYEKENSVENIIRKKRTTYKFAQTNQAPRCNALLSTEQPVHMPLINSCPSKTFSFSSCMTAEQKPSVMYCDYFGRRKKYDFGALDGFLMRDRSNCKIAVNGESYNFNCNGHVRRKRTYYSLYTRKYLHRPSPSTIATTTTTTTTPPPPYKTDCIAIKLQSVLHPQAPLKLSEKACNIQAVSNTRKIYPDTVGRCPSHLGYWSRWFNRIHPSTNSYGDVETLQLYKREFGYLFKVYLCEQPFAIQARTIDFRPYTITADNVHVHPHVGLTCHNSQGHTCNDYKVRFCCPRRYHGYPSIHYAEETEIKKKKKKKKEEEIPE